MSADEIVDRTAYYSDLSRYETAESLWRKSGLSEREMNAALNLYDREKCPKWWAVYDRLLGELGTGMMYALCGQFGSGKTVIGAALLRDACLDFFELTHTQRIGREPKYITAPMLFRGLLESFQDGDETGALKRWLRPMLLVIDEAHERAETERQDRLFREIIDVRYGRQLDTILISNLRAGQLASSLGGSAVDRLRQCGGFIECNWPSFRGANNA